MTEKIKILFLASDPVDVAYHPQLEREVRDIDARIQAGPQREKFELVSCWAVRPSDLQLALLRHAPQIVHFSGHGSKAEGIILEDSDGNLKPVSKQALIRLFTLLPTNIRLVFLNACHARRQIDGLREVIDFTIAMNAAITDQAALLFAPHFYQALAFGRSVKEAFELAKNTLELEGILESKIPELLERKGVDAATVVLAEKQTAQAKIPETAAPDPESLPNRGGRTIYKDISNSIIDNQIEQKGKGTNIVGGEVQVAIGAPLPKKRQKK